MANVTAYWRPTSLGQALDLLEHPGAVVVGGGTSLHGRADGPAIEVVDLQALDLGAVDAGADGTVVIGATATLQQVADSGLVPDVVRDAARRERPSTLRRQATVGGCVATGDWESELLAALLVHDAVVRLGAHAGFDDRPLAEVLAALPLAAGTIVAGVTIQASGVAASARTARTRADRAIVAAYARRVDDRRLLALTGVASRPVLVQGPDGLDPPSDFRGTGAYRRSLAATLLGRATEGIA